MYGNKTLCSVVFSFGPAKAKVAVAKNIVLSQLRSCRLCFVNIVATPFILLVRSFERLYLYVFWNSFKSVLKRWYACTAPITVHYLKEFIRPFFRYYPILGYVDLNHRKFVFFLRNFHFHFLYMKLSLNDSNIIIVVISAYKGPGTKCEDLCIKVCNRLCFLD